MREPTPTTSDEVPTTTACIVDVGHPADEPAFWRDANSNLVVCDRHRDQYDERPDLGPYDWREIA